MGSGYGAASRADRGYTPQSGRGVFAKRTTDVINSIGVNVHVARFGTTLSIADQAALLADVGIKWVRLGVHNPASDAFSTAANTAACIDQFAAVGVKTLVLPANLSGVNALVDTALGLVTSPSMVLGLENHNEIDNSGVTQAQCVTQHAALVAMAVNNGFTNLDIYAPSLLNPNNFVNYSPIAGTDVGNCHLYQGGANIDNFNVIAYWHDELDAFTAAPTKILGEFGYPHHPNTALAPDIFNVDTTAGVYICRAVIHAQTISNYFTRTALYELNDEPGLSGRERYFGLVEFNGTIKASYTYLKRMIAYLADAGGTAATFTPTRLQMTASSEAGWYYGLFQKANGRFYVPFWQGGTSVGDLTLSMPATIARTLTFDRSFTTINLYNPRTNTTTAAVGSGTSYAATVTGDMQFLELVP